MVVLLKLASQMPLHEGGLAGAAVADEDELEAGVVHRLLVGERLKEGNKDNGR